MKNVEENDVGGRRGPLQPNEMGMEHLARELWKSCEHISPSEWCHTINIQVDPAAMYMTPDYRNSFLCTAAFLANCSRE